MVPKEGVDPDLALLKVQQGVDHSFAVRSAVDVVTQKKQFIL
jgi:hypothetical protein